MKNKKSICKPAFMQRKGFVNLFFPTNHNSKFFINESADRYEQEADAVANKVMNTFVPGSDSSFFKAKPIETTAVQRKGSSANPVSPTPAVSQTLNSGGESMDKSTRSFMEQRFGHDFGNVQIHNDSTAQRSAEDIDAQAYTNGQHIVFGEGYYQPNTIAGKQLLAHELVHVIQQSTGINNAAIQRAPHIYTEGKGRKAKKFQVGEVTFEGQAKEEAKKLGVLLPSEDQRHIRFDGDAIGYEISYTNPVDPFRWNKLKDLIDSNQKIIVRKVGLTDNFDTLDIDPKISGGRQVNKSGSLAGFGAAGYTLVSESLYKSVYPKDTSFNGVSPVTDTIIIYYSTALSDPSDSSLSHELFGHAWLAVKKVPFLHPLGKTAASRASIPTHGTLDATHGILDPLGNPYSGTVLNFINTYIGSESGVINSPTQGVGSTQYTKTLADFKTDFIKNSSGTLNNAWKVGKTVDPKLDILAGNYILAPDGSTGTINKPAIIKDITAWYSTISKDKQYIFLMLLDWATGNILSKRPALAQDLLKVLTPPEGMTPIAQPTIPDDSPTGFGGAPSDK